ncbi:NAD(P)/FAD-dependent oxidoreductase, partial [Streptococcus thoraltensis]
KPPNPEPPSESLSKKLPEKNKKTDPKKTKYLINNIKAIQRTVTGKMNLTKYFVTQGWGDLKEIKPKTLESKKVPVLHFAGEVFDINAHTGGFNITSALCSCWVDGAHHY